MSIQALRERLAALKKEANHQLENKGDQVWNKADQDAFDKKMDEIELVQNQIKAHQRLLDIEADAQAADMLLNAVKPGSKKENAALNAVALYLRNSLNDMSPEQIVQVKNAMSTTTGSEGGYTVPTEVAAIVIDALKAYGGMREAAEIITSASGNDWNYPSSDGTTDVGEIVGQNSAAAAGEITFGTVPLVVYKFSSKKLALPWELVQDSAIDIVAYVIKRLMTRIARKQNAVFTMGTGSSEPYGIAARASSGKVGTTGQTVTVIHDDLVDLLHAVNRAYRARAAWMMADSSLKVIRKIKDTAGRPIFTPGYEYGITEDAPDMLLGKKIVINDDIAAMAANAKSILFGDLKQYVIRDVTGAEVRRFDDSAFALNGQVGFCGWQRSGGNLLDTTAVKYYQNSAT